MPPAYRQAMETIAMGSAATAASALFSCWRRAFSFSEARSASTICSSGADISVLHDSFIGGSARLAQGPLHETGDVQSVDQVTVVRLRGRLGDGYARVGVRVG